MTVVRSMNQNITSEKRNTRAKRLVFALSALLFLIAAFLICFWTLYGRHALRYECTNNAMGTYVQQTVYGTNRKEAAAKAAEKIGELENLISLRAEGSDTAKLNEAAGADWVKINPLTLSLLKTGLDVAQKSNGAFDPTMLPVFSLWDFAGENQHVPSADEIRKFLPYVDYRGLRVDENASSASLKRHLMAVSLEGMEAGAACDAAVGAYRQAGADAAVVAVKSSVGVYGVKADRTLWRIAVRGAEADTEPVGQISLREGFVSTSRTEDRQFQKNGVTYHHLLNPKTGYPESNGLVSVTVTAKTGALSDALSSACFVAGKEKGEALLRQYDAGGIFIDRSGKVLVTENLKNSFEITNDRYSAA